MENFEQKMRQIAQDVHDENSTTDQFAVSQTPFHTHNGSDSQRIPFLRLSDTPTSYHGKAGQSVIVNTTENALVFNTISSTNLFSGTVAANGSTSGLFPVGWSVAYFSGTHRYVVTHNLNTTKYTVVATALNTVSGYSVNIRVSDNNTFTISGFITGTGGSADDTGFQFILSIV